jgi:UDP-N-acetylmuramoylalanine--D-glutamate ligase
VKGNKPESDTCVFGTQVHPGLHARCRNHLIRFMNDGEIVDEYDLIDYKNLPGTHNYFNIMAAIAICRRLKIPHQDIMAALLTFKGLPHRIEYVGEFKGIGFYNDSISTIPESAIAAVKALRGVETLILGGFDRGIDYQVLIDFLKENPIQNIAFTGPAGHRMLEMCREQNALPQNFIETDDYEAIVRFCYEKTPVGGTALLSPAAASYNQFKNFEERGNTFKQLVVNAL